VGQSRRLRHLSLAVLVSAVLACSAPSTNSQSSAPAATASVPTGQIVLSEADDPATLNPAISALAVTSYHAQFVFDGLTRPDKDMRPSPSLAESWVRSADGLSYTFKLRKGVKFHNGQDFTAADVKFTWELICNPDNKAGVQLAGYFGSIEGAAAYRDGKATEITGITAPDPYTVQVKLTSDYGPFLTVSAFQPILPKSVYSSIAVADLGKDKTARSPIGTGPFKFVEWRANDQLIYAANADYWGGAPKLARLIVKTVPDPATLPSLLRAGTVDVVGMTTSMPAIEFKNFSEDKNFTVREMAGGFNRYVEFNLVNPVFEDVRSRQALVYAVDRKAIVDGLYLGHARIVNAPIQPGSWAYTEPKTQYPYDVEKAKSLLKDAGWTPGPDGILMKGALRFSFTLLTYPEFAQDYPLAMQQAWRKIGVDATLKPMEFAAIFAPLYLAHKFDAFAFQMPIGTYTDPSFPLAGYFGSALNRNGYKSAKTDSLIAQGAATSDEVKRKQSYADLTEQLAQDVPSFFPVMPNDIWVYSSKVKLPAANLAVLLYVNAKDWERTQ
jgi:peptide/nickel transport system substrate-binding protein